MYYDFQTRKYRVEVYSPGEEVEIPEFKIHWLINPSSEELSFICEYAPHPWEKESEPEFPNLEALLKFMKEKDLLYQLTEHGDLDYFHRFSE